MCLDEVAVRLMKLVLSSIILRELILDKLTSVSRQNTVFLGIPRIPMQGVGMSRSAGESCGQIVSVSMTDKVLLYRLVELSTDERSGCVTRLNIYLNSFES